MQKRKARSSTPSSGAESLPVATMDSVPALAPRRMPVWLAAGLGRRLPTEYVDAIGEQVVTDSAVWDLDGPVVRITTPHIPLPAAEALEDMAGVLERIAPDEIHISTPVRPPAESWVEMPDAAAVERALSVLGNVSRVLEPVVVAVDSPLDSNGSSHITMKAIRNTSFVMPTKETQVPLWTALFLRVTRMRYWKV